jgi:hypothetical protein
MFDFNFTSSAFNRNPLSCVWIETGDPKQPLACIWIDERLRLLDEHNQSYSGEKASLCFCCTE